MKSVLNPYKNREVNLDKLIYVYRNLNSTCNENKYSVMQNGLVVAHTNQLQLKDVKFIIRPSGKQRAIKTKERNVHAFIRGYVKDFDVPNIDMLFQLKYNPFNDTKFNIQTNITKIKRYIDSCKLVIINDLGIYLKLI